MGETAWIVMGRQAGRVLAYRLEGAVVTAKTKQGSETDALDALGNKATIIRIGESIPNTVPCPVLPPAGGTLPSITQDKPAGALSGWVRLWIAGFLERHKNWDGVICVSDGDVTHWVHVSADEVVSFASFLTLRLIAALGGSDTPDPRAIADSGIVTLTTQTLLA